MRREERVTVQGPVKEQQPDGMSHRGYHGITAESAPQGCASERAPDMSRAAAPPPPRTRGLSVEALCLDWRIGVAANHQSTRLTDRTQPEPNAHAKPLERPFPDFCPEGAPQQTERRWTVSQPHVVVRAVRHRTSAIVVARATRCQRLLCAACPGDVPF